jgi:hypothetical protein
MAFFRSLPFWLPLPRSNLTNSIAKQHFYYNLYFMRHLVQLLGTAALAFVFSLATMAEVAKPSIPAQPLTDGDTYVLMNHNTPNSYFNLATDGALTLSASATGWEAASFTAKKISDGVYEFKDAKGKFLGNTIDADGQRQNGYFTATEAQWNLTAGDYDNFYHLTAGTGNLAALVGEPVHLNTANSFWVVSTEATDIYYQYNNPYDADSKNFCFCHPADVTRYIALGSLYKELTLAYQTLKAGDNASLSAAVQTAEATYNSQASTASQIDAQVSTLADVVYQAQLSSASVDNPVDLSSKIVNPGFDSNDGWLGTFTINTGSSNAEKFGSNFCAYQKITNLPVGLYKVAVQGFYRDGGFDYAATQRDAGAEVLNAYLFANTDSVAIESIFTDAGKLDVGVTPTTSTNYGTIPNGMGDGTTWFGKGYYNANSVETLITSASDTLTLGISKYTTVGADWVLFDNFQLYYLGAKAFLEKIVAKAEDFQNNLGDNAIGAPDLNALDSLYTLAQAMLARTGVSSDEAGNMAKALGQAYSNAVNSLKAYTSLKAMLDLATSTVDQGFSTDSLSDYMLECNDAYTNRTFTGVEAANAAALLKTLIDAAKVSDIKEGDVTYLITNPGFDNNNVDGWTVDASGTPGLSNSEVEFYEKTFNISQSFSGLRNGKYTLKVQGFYRQGYGDYDAFKAGTDDVPVKVYMNNSTQKIKNIFADASATQLTLIVDDKGVSQWGSDPVDIDGTYTPCTMEGARKYFDKGLYDQTMSTVVTNGKLTLGIKGASYITGSWCLFDNFRLSYDGCTAADLAETLEQLKTQALEYVGVPMAADAQTQIKDALAKADAASTDAMPAIAALNDAIEAAQTSTTMYQPLGTAFVAADAAAAAMADASDAARTAYQTAYTAIQTKYKDGAYTTDKEIADAVAELQAAVVAFQMYDIAGSDAAPADVTSLIVNPNFDNNNLDGWTVTKSGDAGLAFKEVEFYEKTFNLHQTIRGLKNGYYRLSITGFQRNGGASDVAQHHTAADGSEGLNVKLYENADSTLLMSIVADASKDILTWGAEGDSTAWGTDKYAEGYGYVPNTMEAASNAFAAGRYTSNSVYTHVTDNILTLGLCQLKTAGWVLFDTFRLEYLGTSSVVSVNPTEAVEATVVRSAYYSLGGMQLERPVKGVNIVRQTMSDGSVKVRKIFVR